MSNSFSTPWTVALQAPLSMGFPEHGQEYWSGLPFPSPRDLPNPEIKPELPPSPELTSGFFTTEPPGKPPDLLGHWLQTRGWISLNLSAPTFHGCGFYFATKLNSLHVYSLFRSTCSTTGYNFKDQRNTTNSITLNPTSQNTDSAILDDQKLPKDHRIKETKSVYFSGQCTFTFDWRKTQMYFKQLTLLNFFTLRITIISPISVIF